MNRIFTGRRGGKTTQIMEAFMASPTGILLVFSEDEAMRLIKEYNLDDHKARSILTPHQLVRLKGHNMGARFPLFIDNMEYVLQSLLAPYGRVDTITASLSD